MMSFNCRLARLVLWVFCASLLACASHHQAPRWLVVTGHGANLEEARKDAIRNAIQSQMGAFVLSDLTISNDTIVEDSVSEYSGALVDKLQVIESRATPGGGWIFKARIAVLEDAKRQRNRAPLLKSGPIDGQSLTGLSVSYIEKRRQAETTWEKVLNRMPLRAFYYDIIPLGLVEPPTNNGGKVTLGFITAPQWRMDYVAELRQALRHGAQPAVATFATPYGIHWQDAMPSPEQTGICLANAFRSSGLGSSVECFIVDVSTELVKQWLCFAKGVDIELQAKGIGVKPLVYKNLSRGLQYPFMDTDRNNGPSMTFIFQIIEAAELKEISWYPDYIGSTTWTAEVPLETLANLTGISALTGCSI